MAVLFEMCEYLTGALTGRPADSSAASHSERTRFDHDGGPHVEQLESRLMMSAAPLVSADGLMEAGRHGPAISVEVEPGTADGSHFASSPAASDLAMSATEAPVVGRPQISVTDSSGDVHDSHIQFTTERADVDPGAPESTLVRPAHPDVKQYYDVTNTASAPLTISEIQINAPDVTLDLLLTDDPADDIVLQAGETQRFCLTYAPTSPSLTDPDARDFDLSAGLVVLSNAGDTPAYEIALEGASTFNSDINYDGRVDLADLDRLTADLGKTVTDPDWTPTADINGDGTVNLADLGPLNVEFGRQRSSVSAARAKKTEDPSGGAASAAPAILTSVVPAVVAAPRNVRLARSADTDVWVNIAATVPNEVGDSSTPSILAAMAGRMAAQKDIKRTFGLFDAIDSSLDAAARTITPAPDAEFSPVGRRPRAQDPATTDLARGDSAGRGQWGETFSVDSALAATGDVDTDTMDLDPAAEEFDAFAQARCFRSISSRSHNRGRTISNG